MAPILKHTYFFFDANFILNNKQICIYLRLKIVVLRLDISNSYTSLASKQILLFEKTKNLRGEQLKSEQETSCNVEENNDTCISSFLGFGRKV
jgi:hypothetical protein